MTLSSYSKQKETDTPSTDKWGNPTFTVGIVTVTAYPRHGGYSQINISDPDYSCLQFWPDDLRQIAAAFNAAADAVETCQFHES